jgi:hypothetical protein
MTVQPYEAPERLPALELDDRTRTWVVRFRAAAEIATYIGGTEFVPETLRNRPEAITAAILYGAEMGLDPMRSLAMVVVIKGTPALRTEAKISLVLAEGHELWFEESTVTRAIAAGRRKGSDRVGRITFTLDDAKRAGLAGQPNYQKYPAEMLRWRAASALTRTMFADVVGGFVSVEELEGEPVNGTTVELEVEKPKRATRTRKRTATEPAPSAAANPPIFRGGAHAPEPPHPPDTQEPPPVPDEPKLTDAQGRHLFALMRDVGLEDPS